jgi:hypothetical protein
MSPRYVDTNVTNQSFTYNITPTGADKINNITITIPAGYTVVNVTYVSDNGTTLRNSTYQHSNLSVILGSQILVNYTIGYSGGTIVINFTANTSATNITQTAFSSTVAGSNLTSIAADVSGTDTSVTTQQLINVTSVAATKATAYVNGTDYWEFTFTINFTANVTGLLQFKMSNWTNSASNITLTSCTGGYCATLRDSTNANNNITVGYDYNMSTGVSFTGTQGNTKNVILKMIIPTGTLSSTSWWATYSGLFRSAA